MLCIPVRIVSAVPSPLSTRARSAKIAAWIMCAKRLCCTLSAVCALWFARRTNAEKNSWGLKKSERKGRVTLSLKEERVFSAVVIPWRKKSANETAAAENVLGKPAIFEKSSWKRVGLKPELLRAARTLSGGLARSGLAPLSPRELTSASAAEAWPLSTVTALGGKNVRIF